VLVRSSSGAGERTLDLFWPTCSAVGERRYSQGHFRLFAYLSIKTEYNKA
jgi:hypothetical protein